MKKIILTFLFLVSIVAVYSQEQTLFDRPNTIILLSMPANEDEFNNIFKRNSSQGELDNIVTLLNQYKDLKNIYVLKEQDDLDKIMKIILSKADKKLYDEYFPRIGFSVIGHNENGNFYFPNGTTTKLEDVEKKFLGFPGMFLSCNAKKYGVTGVDYKLTYSEALNIAIDIDNIVTEMHNKKACNIYFDTPRKISTTMIATLNSRNKIKYAATFLGAAGGLTGGFVLLKQLDTPQDKPQSDSTKLVNNE
jgi:hypothetical protein